MIIGLLFITVFAGAGGLGLGALLHRMRWDKLVEQSRKEENKRLLLFLDAFPDAAAFMDATGTLVLANEAFKELFILDDQPITALDTDTLAALHLPTDLLEDLREHKERGEPYSLTTNIQDSSGAEVPIELKALGAPRRDQIGLMVRDRRLEEALLESLEMEKTRREEDVAAHSRSILESTKELRRVHREYRELYDDAPFMAHTTDPYGTVVNCNDTEAKVLGYDKEELVGKSILDIVSPDQERMVREHIDGVFETGKGAEIELQMISRSGSKVDVVVRSHPALEENEVCVGVRSVMADVTAERQREALLQRATQALAEKNAILEVKTQEILRINHTRSEFISSVSHELRTPLHAVIGYAELLGRGLYGDLNERQQKSVDGIVNRGNDLLTLINNILDISRIDAGRLRLELTRYNPTEVLEEVIQTGHLLLREAERADQDDDWDFLDSSDDEDRHVELRSNFQQAPVEVTGDRGRYKQVVLNLVGNAIRYTESGHVDVICRREADGSFVTAVSDTGIGISPEDQDAIFDPFYQVEASSTRVHGGTGLGLSIARRLTEQMGGRLTLSSRAGVGSTFYLRMPVRGSQTDETAEEAQSDMELPTLARQAPTALVVGQEGVGFLGIKEGLQQEGLELLEAKDAMPGAEVARSKLPTVVVNLLSGSQDNPADLVTLVRSDPVTAHIPIVMVGPSSLSSAARELQVDEYVSVPTDGIEVSERIWPLIGQHQRRILLIGADQEAVDTIGTAVRETGTAVARARRGSRGIEFLARNKVPMLVACNDMPNTTILDLLSAVGAIDEENRPAVVIVAVEPITPEERSGIGERALAVLDPGELTQEEMAVRILALLEPIHDPDAALTQSLEIRSVGAHPTASTA